MKPVIDVAAGLVALTVGALVAFLRLLFSDRPSHSGRELMVLDNAYSWEEILHRGMEASITSRSLDGFFDRVWHVHPLVDARSPAIRQRFGRPTVIRLGDEHRIIEPGTGRFRRLGGWPALNMALSQVSLLLLLARVLRQAPVRALRVGDPFYLGPLGLILGRGARIPLVIRINGNHDALRRATGQVAYPRLIPSAWLETRIPRFVLPRADLVAGSNLDNQAYALANGARPERTTVFPYGALIDPVHYQEPSERRAPSSEVVGTLPDGGAYIAAVTRLEPVKRAVDLLSVMADLQSEPQLALIVVGDGGQRAELERRAGEMGLAGRIRFAGNRSQAEIACVLAGAKVVLAPMAGRALVESALAARPVVAYDVDWHRELISDDSLGVLVDEGDTMGMARAVAALLADPERAKEMGRRCRQHALDTMDPVSLRHTEAAAYKCLLEDPLRR